MKIYFRLLISFLMLSQCSFSQENQNAAILKFVLAKYYATENVIVKNRLQHLNLYCKKAPNNEETFEVINKNALLKQNATVIKNQIKNKADEDWSKELNTIFATENQYLKKKVNNCLSQEDYQKLVEKYNENNLRLMIVSKPMYFANNFCLLKVTFYRTIEHNNGCYLLLENNKGVWSLKETLNEWAT